METTEALKDAVRYYAGMKKLRRKAMSAYCESNTQENLEAHQSACNAVQHGANTIAELVERMVTE